MIGTGGYVCGPILMAASLKHIPTVVQEQNVLPGITNKILSRFVSRIAVGSEAAKPYFPAEKTVYTGNPIRRAVMEADREEGARGQDKVDGGGGVVFLNGLLALQGVHVRTGI